MVKHPSKTDLTSNGAAYTESAEVKQLRLENARLKSLLDKHSITWEDEPPVAKTSQTTKAEHEELRLSSPENIQQQSYAKVALFRSLFRGRTDVYPVRWESAKGGYGYSPACANEWKRGLCNKRQTKCGDCANRLLLPVTDQVIYDHLAGKSTVGVYPLLDDNCCYFLAADFDKGDWQEDSRAFMQSCRDLNIPVALEISRSGNGAHAWIFFAEPVLAREARHLGMALISQTCDRIRQLSLASYDRFFPNQDTIPKGGFGNLIALPLQKYPREKGFSVFVDENFSPYPDQWAFLASIQPMPSTTVEDAIIRVSGGRHPLDVSFTTTENEDHKPWQPPKADSQKISGLLPESITLVLANQIFIDKSDLSQPLTNRLIRLAAFQNPEFYKAQAMRFSVWDKPRIIGCAENFPQYIGLPRGCLHAVLDLLEYNNIQVKIKDERLKGCKVSAKFIGKLRKDQKIAVREMMQQETGILCAPTAFGKTVTAAKLISRRKRSTLILVHRTELLNQWLERLNTFLELPDDSLGALGGGKKKLSGKIDIAVMQSLARREDQIEILAAYGQIIVDECHHISAFSFEAIIKQAKAKYIVGLTATPIRRDGHHPIIFMQCGPIRHSAKQQENIPDILEVRPQHLTAPYIPSGSTIQDVFRIISDNTGRNRHIVKDVLAAYAEGRKILVLTERTAHLKLLSKAFADDIDHLFVLHGRLSKKKRAFILAELVELADSTPRVLLATGKLIGEGFDHPPLDTLVLAMPVSWKGTLQQYAGRLHREHIDKHDVRIYDYVETYQPQLTKMWDKRQRGYRAMGYSIKSFKVRKMPLTRGRKMRYGWLTDIHLEFMRDSEAKDFVKELATQKFDGLFLTGDISTAKGLESHIKLFEDLYPAPVYFVLGNHDFYGGTIETTRSLVQKICSKSKWLHWLPVSGVVSLAKDTCLIGHDGWADGRLGDYSGSKVLLNDYVKIENFGKAGSVGRLALLQSLGDQAATFFKNILAGALQQYQHVIVLTHVPPFKEACWHEGEISANDWLPHFSCKAVGDVLAEAMKAAPDKQMTVLCGHTHSSGQCQILPNLLVKTGGAKYGSPRIQEIIDCGEDSL